MRWKLCSRKLCDSKSNGRKFSNVCIYRVFIEMNVNKYVLAQPENNRDQASWRKSLNERKFISCDNGLNDNILIFETFWYISWNAWRWNFFMDGIFTIIHYIHFVYYEMVFPEISILLFKINLKFCLTACLIFRLTMPRV